MTRKKSNSQVSSMVKDEGKSKMVTRRDWFRLGKPTRLQSSENRSLGESSPKQGTHLQPIEHPPNHDGLDLNNLPPMREAMLTAAQVSELFSDIQSFARQISLMQRGYGQHQSSDTRAIGDKQICEAKNRLLSGSISRMQVRYFWNESYWIDTLQSSKEQNTCETTGQFRLVRIKHESITIKK